KFLPWLSSLPNRPTAMLVEQDTRATTLVQLLEANGCPVPARMSVLAISSAARQAKSMEGLTCVLSSVREMILRAVDILLEDVRSAGRTVRVEKIPSTFVPGHTCRSLEGNG